METGDELIERHLFPSDPRWQSLHDETPDDAFPAEEEGGEDIANREGEDATEDLATRLTGALSLDLQPLGKALAGALQAGDEAAMTAALRKISARMPEFLESTALEEALGEEFVKALSGETRDASQEEKS
jgi:hypothetical protein